MTVLDAVRSHLATVGLVRAPDTNGSGARPWPPPCWKHPADGPVAPGDALEQGRPAAALDDGLVVTLLHAQGIPPGISDAERKIEGVDIIFRGTAVPAIFTLDALIREQLHGTLDPGGRSDWMLGSLYVVQSKLYRPISPLGSTGSGVFSFMSGYLIESRV